MSGGWIRRQWGQARLPAQERPCEDRGSRSHPKRLDKALAVTEPAHQGSEPFHRREMQKSVIDPLDLGPDLHAGLAQRGFEVHARHVCGGRDEAGPKPADDGLEVRDAHQFL